MKNMKSKVLSFLFVTVFSVFGSGVFALNTAYANSVSQCYSSDFPDRTIVEFDEGKILSSGDEAGAMKTEPVSLAAGTYNIVLVASDSYPERVGVSQPNESWKLILKNDDTTVATTDPTPDLEDYVESATETLTINDFTILSDVNTAVAYHAVYPDTSNPNSVQPVCAGFDLIPPPTEATIVATKIVCDSEADLPNWGDGGPDITSDTASDFLAENENCYEEEWTFEWAPEETANPGDETEVAGGDWTPFSGSVEVPSGALIWVREQFDNDYIPFTGANTTEDVSAELYCSTDVLNYDNYDWIDPVDAGETYHCVGFNVLEEPEELPECSDNVDNADSEDELADEADPGCHTDGNVENSQSYDSEDNDETDAPPQNLPPTADAGPDQIITLPTNSTNLNGTGTDTDGTIASYVWTQVSGPALDPNDVEDPAISGLVAGTYVFKLTVTDDDGATDDDTVTITVNPEVVGEPECSDNVDNSDSEDTLADELDPGCHTDRDVNNPDSYNPDDDDESNESIECSDGIDNADGEDSLIDSADPGCHTDGDADNSESYDPNDDNETDDTRESDLPQCSDNIDNDDDGEIDFGDDAGCDSDRDNDESDESGGGGGGSSRRRSTPPGQVLGAQTVPSLCNWTVDTYMRQGYRNDAEQVKTLQEFLNWYMNSGLVVDGIYGPKTEAAVRAFQMARQDNVLRPWGLTDSTGIFYKTTLVEAKNLMCPQTQLPIPTDLINWSQNSAQVPARI